MIDFRDRHLAAMLLTELVLITNRMEAAELLEERDTDPLADGIMTNGEALRCVPTLIALLHAVHPEFRDTDVFNTTLRDAQFMYATVSNLSLN
jgi:hypothetical protein